jgi:YHS domain-containing protein
LVYIEESYTLLEDFNKRKTYYFCLRESLLGEDFNLKVKVVDSKGREYLVKSQDLNNDFLKNSRNYVRYWDPSYSPVRFFLVLKKHLMPLEHVFPVGTPTMILRRVMVGPYPEIRVETAHAIPHLCGGSEYMSLRDSISKQFYVVKKSKVTLIPKN